MLKLNRSRKWAHSLEQPPSFRSMSSKTAYNGREHEDEAIQQCDGKRSSDVLRLSAPKASHRSKQTTSEPEGIKTLLSTVNLKDSWRRPTAIPPLATNSYFLAQQQGGGGPDSFGLNLMLIGSSLKSGTSGILTLSLPSHPRSSADQRRQLAPFYSCYSFKLFKRNSNKWHHAAYRCPEAEADGCLHRAVSLGKVAAQNQITRIVCHKQS